MRYFIKLLVWFLVFINVSFVAHANSKILEKKDVKKFIHNMVVEHHFKKSTVEAILSKAHYNQEIIDKMNTPYEKKPWGTYRGFFLTPQRLQAGLDFWEKHKVVLNKVEHTYGVPASIIVSILGVETLYGDRQGNYNVLDALTTLAFFYPKRSVYFTKELAQFLLLCKEQHKDCDKYYGSYAGAIGQPQFMPSSYRYYAVGYTNKDTSDLVNDSHDSIASVANYFYKHGWHQGQAVAQEVKFSRFAFRNIKLNASYPNIATSLLVKRGILPKNAKYPKTAGILKLETEKGYEYWVAYPNFYVITRYNTSPHYALAVYLLAQAFEKGHLHS